MQDPRPEWLTFDPTPPPGAPCVEVRRAPGHTHVGRGKGSGDWTNDVVLEGPNVSRRHALLFWRSAAGRSTLVVQILGSHASFLVSGDQVSVPPARKSVPLEDGDRLVLPSACLYVRIQAPGEATLAIVDRGGSTPPAVNHFVYRELRIDLDSGFAWLGARPLNLGPQQKELLRILASNPRRALRFDRSVELQQLLAGADDPEGQYRQQIYAIRRRLGPELRGLIQTVAGDGSYLFLPPPEAQYRIES